MKGFMWGRGNAIIIKNIKYLTDSENYAIISKIYSWICQTRSLK
jgi:hypothetical protein